MKIWLDDLRQAPSGWQRTYNARTTIFFLETEDVTEISLDHDLGNPEVVGTGYDVALFIYKRAFEGKKVPSVCRIHSQNPVGAKQMQSALERINDFFPLTVKVVWEPYSS